MNRATLYDTPAERAKAPCPNCGMANGVHTPEKAMTCWRAEVRHPDADADDMLFLVAGAVAGIITSPPALVAVTANRTLEELQDAIADRIGTGEVDAEIIEA